MKIMDQKQGNLRRENTQEELNENSESSCQSDTDYSSVSLDQHCPPKKRVREILDEQSESSYKVTQMNLHTKVIQMILLMIVTWTILLKKVIQMILLTIMTQTILLKKVTQMILL